MHDCRALAEAKFACDTRGGIPIDGALNCPANGHAVVE